MTTDPNEGVGDVPKWNGVKYNLSSLTGGTCARERVFH